MQEQATLEDISSLIEEDGVDYVFAEKVSPEELVDLGLSESASAYIKARADLIQELLDRGIDHISF